MAIPTTFMNVAMTKIWRETLSHSNLNHNKTELEICYFYVIFISHCKHIFMSDKSASISLNKKKVIKSVTNIKDIKN